MKLTQRTKTVVGDLVAKVISDFTIKEAQIYTKYCKITKEEDSKRNMDKVG